MCVQTRLAQPHLRHVDVSCHTHPRVCTSQGHCCTLQLGFCGSAWLVADQGLVLTMFRVTRTLEGHRDTVHPESLVFTTRAGCPFRPDPPQSLFKWKFCKSTSASMRSTIWLTAVSGKRNNQIIIQSWVFNSRKASGC